MSSNGDLEVESQSRRGSFATIEFTDEVKQQCLKQVEFYFSEFNLPYDKFLRMTVAKNDGWVPITTIASFNRMKKFRPVDKVVECLRESKVLEVSDDGENVKRIEPLDFEGAKNARLEQNKRTLAVINFPHENVDDMTVLQENLEKFFNGLSEVNQVRLRRDHKKKFNGTVIVEFKTLPQCEEFLKTYSGEDAETLSYEGKKLEVFTKKQYDLQREATRSKNFGGSGQRSRSFTGHRKNMPKSRRSAKTDDKSESEPKEESKNEAAKESAPAHEEQS
ncbi:hypothetical protein HG537_0E01450 [Torulaspora globosa]|uniref:HTH La-type RNA-binding domain-containing protein n=1 Tax=Torulaspora globosa TaxID=48254 RepID=A0A7H9HTW1_9SACH|nr:hypothetical protein HG537_0E01450 [Torulaspora sp. CBS 2947]